MHFPILLNQIVFCWHLNVNVKKVTDSKLPKRVDLTVGSLVLIMFANRLRMFLSDENACLDVEGLDAISIHLIFC